MSDATSPVDELIQRMLRAHELLGAGRVDDAEWLLRGCVEEAMASVPYPLGMAMYRLLGECARKSGRLAEAIEHYELTLAIAQQARDADVASAALTGISMVHIADDRLSEAKAVSAEAVRIARFVGPGQGLANALQIHGHVLSELGDPGAVEHLTEARDQLAPDSPLRGNVMDHLGMALRRQGRVAEALEQGTAAVDLLRSVGTERDVYLALTNLATSARGVDAAVAAAAFEEAHDLIHRMHAEVNVAHYTERYRQRVAAIEAGTPQILRETHAREDGGTLTDGDVALTIGLSAARASAAVDEAEILLMRHRHADAYRLLREAEALWQELGARHELPRVWCSLGLLHKDMGDFAQARTLLEQARSAAHEIGRAGTEATATSNLCVVWLATGGTADLSLLELLARARSLVEFVGAPVAQAASAAGVKPVPYDLGMLDAVAASHCLEYGATDLAEFYLRRAVDVAERAGENSGDIPLANRRAQRLTRLARFLVEQGRADETADLRDRLTRLAASVDDPLVRYPAQAGLGRLALDTGQWTDAALARLVAACDAYEELRDRRGDSPVTDDYAQVGSPPYTEAVELALHLGAADQAFELLERSKARVLRDLLREHAPADADDPLISEEAELWQRSRALRDPAACATRTHERVRLLHAAEEELGVVRERLGELWELLSDRYPHLRAHRLAEPATVADVTSWLAERGATLVAYFVGTRAVHVFTLSALGLSATPVIERDDPALREFAELLHDTSDTTMSRVLAHPVHARLTRATGAGPVFVVPHGFLHLAPLHIAENEVRPRTHLLPSASLLRTAEVRRPVTTGPVLVGGDAGGDLPFARAECGHVAGRFAVAARYGDDLTAQWLAAGLGERPKLVHLACHGVFDDRRPERSGLVLATPDGRRDVVTLSRLGALDWSGALVVLTACHSGKHRVRRGDELAGLGVTLLAAGASALVINVQAVSDLSTALLMTWFYDQLAPTATWDPDHVGEALAHAQRRVRDVTARDLITWAADHTAADADQANLSYDLTRLAHETAGNVDERAAWTAHRRHLLRTGTPPTDVDWDRQRRLIRDPAYLARPFADPMYWAPFTVLGAG